MPKNWTTSRKRIISETYVTSQNRSIYNGILCSHQKDEILPFAMTLIELEGIMLSEIIRGIQLYDLTDMLNLRNKAMNHRGREEKMKWDETREGDKPYETLNFRK